jgi:hypothetical protein
VDNLKSDGQLQQRDREEEKSGPGEQRSGLLVQKYNRQIMQRERCTKRVLQLSKSHWILAIFQRFVAKSSDTLAHKIPEPVAHTREPGLAERCANWGIACESKLRLIPTSD